MNWQLVRLADVTPSPWRNGGGVTRELLAWPNAHDWVWRISVAEVSGNGPFSQFVGVQRWFAVLDGAGVRLTVGTGDKAQMHELTRRSAPFCFDGAVPVDCQLLEGATQDFNLMVRSDRAGAKMERLSGTVSFVYYATKLIAIYAGSTVAAANFHQKNVLIPPHSLAWCELDAGDRVQINAAEALWMEIDV
jgi:hypothetical protein